MELTTLLLAESEKAPMIAPTWVFGVIPLVLFLALGLIMWTYRDVANRHTHKAEAHATDHAASAGATSHGSGHESHSGH